MSGERAADRIRKIRAIARYPQGAIRLVIEALRMLASDHASSRGRNDRRPARTLG